MTTHRLLPLIAATAVGFATPPAAHASSIRLTVAEDPVAEVGVPVRVTGLADRDASVEIRAVRRSEQCATATYVDGRSFDAGPFDLRADADIGEPGAYTLCGILKTLDGRAPVVTAVPVVVRRPRTTILSVRAPRTVPLDSAVLVSAAGVGEAARHVSTVLARPGTSCREADGYSNSVGGSDVLDAGRWTTSDGGDLDEYGRWTACVVVRPQYPSDPAEQIVAAAVDVSRECTQAALRAAEAKEAWLLPAEHPGDGRSPWRLVSTIGQGLSRCDARPAERRRPPSSSS